MKSKKITLSIFGLLFAFTSMCFAQSEVAGGGKFSVEKKDSIRDMTPQEMERFYGKALGEKKVVEVCLEAIDKSAPLYPEYLSIKEINKNSKKFSMSKEMGVDKEIFDEYLNSEGEHKEEARQKVLDSIRSRGSKTEVTPNRMFRDLPGHLARLLRNDKNERPLSQEELAKLKKPMCVCSGQSESITETVEYARQRIIKRGFSVIEGDSTTPQQDVKRRPLTLEDLSCENS